MLLAVVLVGCSPGAPVNETDVADRIEPAGAASEGNVTTIPASKGSGPVPSPFASQFTTNNLGKCRLVEKNEEEGPYYRHHCPGIGGFGYEVIESDLRQNLVIIDPAGGRSELSLNRIGGGGFSTLGTTFDWRGPAGLPPRTMTVRFNVNEDPEPEAPPRSYLVVIQLAAPACAVVAIAPGPTQSVEARRITDSPTLPACLG